MSHHYQHHPHSNGNGGASYMRNGSSNGYAKPSIPPHQHRPPPVNSQTAPHVADEDIQDETLYFERNRIQQLKDERVHIQKKTFTKWCNSYLTKVSREHGWD